MLAATFHLLLVDEVFFARTLSLMFVDTVLINIIANLHVLIYKQTEESYSHTPWRGHWQEQTIITHSACWIHDVNYSQIVFLILQAICMHWYQQDSEKMKTFSFDRSLPSSISTNDVILVVSSIILPLPNLCIVSQKLI